MNRIDIIQSFIDLIDAETYLEIGVRNGDSFLAIQCKNKIGVDVIFTQLPSVGTFFEMTSDEYFRHYASGFDVAFIDGDHSYEQSLRDAENCLKWMNVNGVIILHDCNPTQPEWATPTFVEASPNWCGEVWKTIVTLRTRSDLYVSVLDTDFGVGVVRRDWQETLPYSVEQIKNMTYEDLDKNRETFLNLVGTR